MESPLSQLEARFLLSLSLLFLIPKSRPSVLFDVGAAVDSDGFVGPLFRSSVQFFHFPAAFFLLFLLTAVREVERCDFHFEFQSLLHNVKEIL